MDFYRLATRGNIFDLWNMLDLNSLSSGLIGAVLGAIVAYALQHRLVKMQIDAAEKTQAEFMVLIKDARQYFAERSKQISSSLGNIEHWLKVLASGEQDRR